MKQQQVLADYQRLHPDAPIHILTIDFDDQKKPGMDKVLEALAVTFVPDWVFSF